MAHGRTVLEFWFGAAGESATPAVQERWFSKDPAFDALLRQRFHSLQRAAACGELELWPHEPRGALAYIVLCDQFPRNMFRGSPAAFASDRRALAVARRAVGQRWDEGLAPVERAFMYLPYEHAEDLQCQHIAVELFRGLRGEEATADWFPYAERHLEVIARFGRFPHRNAILGRPSTAEEERFLRRPGARF
jgi:uncharacterized protein (DUF924 family)